MGRILQRYKRLFDDVKKGKLYRLYFLYGPEEYMKKEFVGELVKSALSGDNPAFNLDVIHGDEFDPDRFNDRISSFPLFNERRIVIVKTFEALSKSQKDYVLQQISKTPDSVIVVVEATPKEGPERVWEKNLKKLADARGLSFDFEYFTDEESVERIKARLRKEGLAIEPEALDVLIGSVGTHFSDLVNELDKLVMSADPETNVIDRDTVSAVVGRYRTETIWAFLDDLGDDDTGHFLKRMNKLVDSGHDPVYVLAMLLGRVIQLMEIKLLLKDEGPSVRSPRAMSGRLSRWVKMSDIGKRIDQSRRFELDELNTFLDNLRWAETRLKSTTIHAPSLIETSLVASTLRKRLAEPAN